MSDPHGIWEAPDKKFMKTVLSKGYGFYCPQDGSVCKIKVIADDSKILTDVNDDLIKELIIGDVDDAVERILEACVRSMKNEEICVLKFSDPLQPCQVADKVSSSPSRESEANDNGDGATEGEDKPTETLECSDPESFIEVPTGECGGVDVKDSSKIDSEKLKEECESPHDIVSEYVSAEDEPEDCVNENCCEADSDSNKATLNCDEKEQDSEVHDTEVADPQEDAPDSDGFDAQSPTVYEVQLQLISYTREPEIWEMSITEKWRRANYHKQKGMELYARGSYEWAFRRFSVALKYLISLEHDIPSGHEEGMNIADLKLSCYLNLGACQVRHHNFLPVVKNCSKALELQSSNPKALYRRGAAYIQLQEYEKAKEDLDRALELEPKNQTVIKQQQLLKARVQKLNQYYAKAMKKMFS